MNGAFLSALGSRAKNAARWKWLPGMLSRYPDGSMYRLRSRYNFNGWEIPDKNPPNRRAAWPDLSDPATLGCVLAIVRECLSDESVSTSHFKGQWHVKASTGEFVASAYSEAEALVKALELAPPYE